jgi:phosphoribosyl 1,2-cyclic phosphate phosphodiesterase
MGDFSYVTDANHIAEEELAKLKGLEVLVLNALRKEKHISHFSLDEAIALVEELQPKQAYFTHISHQLGLHAIENVKLPENMALAYDGLQLQLTS